MSYKNVDLLFILIIFPDLLSLSILRPLHPTSTHMCFDFVLRVSFVIHKYDIRLSLTGIFIYPPSPNDSSI